MIDLFKPLSGAMDEVFKDGFDDRNRRAQVVEALMVWLANEARKKEVDDIPQRIENMRKRTEQMVEKMTVVIKDGKMVVTVTGSAESTWRAFRLGTDWFDGDEHALERVLSGLMNDTSI